MLSAIASSLLPRCIFPPVQSPIACAVSGGADSLALLILAVAAGCDVTAYHVDHGLRAGSENEAKVVQAAAERLGAGFVGLRVDCPPGPNLEARARMLRRDVLPEGVATGHTADDQAETVLINLLRGSGLDGLAGMRPGLSHPILGLRRVETVELVESMHLEVVSDPSNSDPSFRRNRIRHELLPLAAEIAERDVAALMARQAALLRDEAEFLDSLAGRLDPTDCEALAGAPRVLARRAVRLWLRQLSGTSYAPSAAAVERVLAVARREVLACEVAGGHTIRRSKGRLITDY